MKFAGTDRKQRYLFTGLRNVCTENQERTCYKDELPVPVISAKMPDRKDI